MNDNNFEMFWSEMRRIGKTKYIKMHVKSTIIIQICILIIGAGVHYYFDSSISKIILSIIVISAVIGTLASAFVARYQWEKAEAKYLRIIEKVE
jgi:hypothetical protein